MGNQKHDNFQFSGCDNSHVNNLVKSSTSDIPGWTLTDITEAKYNSGNGNCNNWFGWGSGTLDGKIRYDLQKT